MNILNCKTALFLLATTLTLPTLQINAEILNVPEDFETIQGAIDESEDGDTILVQPGVYEENLVLNRQDITLGSLFLTTGDADFITRTIIDGGGNDEVLRYLTGDDVPQRLTGFHIRNGSGDGGGGITVAGSNLTITDCLITDNQCDNPPYCSGLYIDRSSVHVLNCTFEQNEGLRTIEALEREFEVSFENCIIRDNTGIGIQIGLNIVAALRNCTIANNTEIGIRCFGGAQTRIEYCAVFRNGGGGIYCSSGSETEIVNCTVFGNSEYGIRGSVEGPIFSISNTIVWNNGGEYELTFNASTVDIEYTDIEGGRDALRHSGGGELTIGEGMIDEDPLFVDPDEDDYHLTEDSPCIDTGDPDSPEDLDETRADMGAFPFLRWGFIEGFVLDAEDNSPLEGATIRTSLEQSAETDDEGYWQIYLARVGQFDITSSLQGYNDLTEEDLELEAFDTLEVIFRLTHPEFQLSERRVVETLQLDEQSDIELSIRNDGNGLLSWVSTERSNNETEIWELLQSLNASEEVNDSRLEGVVFAEDHFFVSGANILGREDSTNMIYVLDREGNEVDRFDQLGEGRYGMRDLAWDGELIWGSGEENVYGFTTEGDRVRSFEGPHSNNSALAWDTDREVLWVARKTGGRIQAFDGEGNENEDLALDQKSLHIDGLAYRQDDPDDYNIYILHSPDNRAEMVHKMNPANGDTMFVTILEPEGGGTPGGAFMTNQFDHQFWAFMSIANDPDGDRIDIWQIVSDSPWFALDPAQGEVEAEASLDINLAFNSQDLAAGIWEGELVFTHNASEEEAILPVMLFVEDGDLSFRHLSLRIGWNLVSVNLQPDNHEDVPGLMSPLVERDLLIVMKNSDGEFYHPGYGFNNIPGWFVDEGYLILMSGEGLLTLRGVPVPPDLAIQLEEGWQIVSYYPRHQIEATVALSGIVDHLIIAKDGRGNFYLPDWEFSNMGNMREGQGYYLNVDVDCELVYQTGEDRIMGSADIPARLLINDLDWIDELNRSSTSFSLLLLTEDLEPGARLEAYTPSGVLAGRGIVGDDGRCGMALWGNDTIISGWVNHSCQQNYGERRHSCRRPYEILFNNGDQPVIKILGGAGVPARQVKLEWLDGEDAGWTAEGWGVARLVANEIVPVEFGIVSVFPNPFNSRTLIEYSLPEPAHTNLAVYDLTGRQVSLIKNDNQRAGVHTVVFNGSNLASGVYMVCLEVGGSKSQWKVALVK